MSPRANARACCDSCRAWMHRNPDAAASRPRIVYKAAGIDPEHLDESARDAWRVALATGPVTRAAFDALARGETVDPDEHARDCCRALTLAGFQVEPPDDVYPPQDADAAPPQDPEPPGPGLSISYPTETY